MVVMVPVLAQCTWRAVTGEIWDDKSGMLVRFEIPDTRERREQLQSKGYRDVGHNIMIHGDE